MPDARRWRGPTLSPSRLLRFAGAVAVPVGTLTAVALANVAADPAPTSVRLTDDIPAQRSLFDVRSAIPGGRPIRRCLVLRNAGNRPVRVSMRLSRPPLDRGLGSSVQMSVERGMQPWATPGTGCRGFRADRRGGAFFRGGLDDFPVRQLGAVADGAPVLLPQRHRAYRISWWLSERVHVQGGSISGVDFVWETSG